MKKINYSIKRIKKDLAENNITTAVFFLKSGSNDVFTIFKEQRLLLIPDEKQQLFSIYKETVKSFYSDQNIITKEINYIRFLELYIFETQNIRKEIENLLSNFQSYTLKSFYYIVNEQLEIYVDSIHQNFFEEIKGIGHSLSLQERASKNEYLFHKIKGQVNDAVFAQNNLVNIFSEIEDQSKNIDIKEFLSEDETELLISSFNLSARLNTCNYILDQVSCNEWFVQCVNKANGKPEIKFDVVDPIFQFAREIGLQSMLSSKIRGRKQERWLKKIIEDYQLEFFDFAWNYFQEKNNILVTDNKSYHRTKYLMITNLDILDAEDELLVGTTENIDVLSRYLIAAFLVSFAFAANGLSKGVPRKKYELTFPYISIND